MDYRLPDAGSNHDASGDLAAGSVDGVDGQLKCTESALDTEKLIGTDRIDLGHMERLRELPADLLILRSQADSRTRSGEVDRRVGHLGRRGLLGRFVTGRAARAESEKCSEGRCREGDGARIAIHEPAPTFGRTAGRAWQSAPMIGAMVQV